MTWHALFTVWWFASGEKIMASSEQTELAHRIYYWYLKITGDEYEY